MPSSLGPARLVILGASGNALDILDIVAALSAAGQHWDVVGLLDDLATSDFQGKPVLGPLAAASDLAAPGGRLDGAKFVLAVGSDRSHTRRDSILARTGLRNEDFATLVHPGAAVSGHAVLSPGCCVGFGAAIAGRCVLEAHVWVGPCAIIGHDSIVEPFAILAPRSTLSGSVRIGACAYIGSGAVVKQGMTIGDRSLVGLGAVVVHDVPPGTVVIGNPARPMRDIDRTAAQAMQAAQG